MDYETDAEDTNEPRPSVREKAADRVKYADEPEAKEG
jgi:hypothetical protein